MRVHAAVFEKLFTPMSVTEVEIGAPGPGEALVKIVAAGVCHTDALARDRDMPFPAPGVLGHEGAGIVEAVGDGVTNVSAGDQVVIGWPWCGECRNCLDGQPRYCPQMGPLVLAGARADGSTALRRPGGLRPGLRGERRRAAAGGRLRRHAGRGDVIKPVLEMPS
jgi:aryl-alcohol dehydrogenase